jgi:membrane protease YdiL (CAAX protease family)
LFDDDLEAPTLTDWERLTEPGARKGRPTVAWLVIGIAVLGIVAIRREPAVPEEDRSGDDPVGLIVMQMSARCLVGLADLAGNANHDLANQLAPFNTGPFGQRLRFVVLTGEFAGPRAALGELQELDRLVVHHAVELRPLERRIRAVVHQLYEDYAAGRWAAPALGKEDRRLLLDELAWFGGLALAPPQGPDAELRRDVIGKARSAVYGVFGLVAWLGLLGIGGIIGLPIFLLCLSAGRLEGGLRSGSRNGGLYAETFACWLLVFFGLNLFVEQLDLGSSKLFGMGLAMAGSLVALAWPTLRGADWRQVRQEIGWSAGRRALLEPFYGLGCYAMALPVVAIVMVCTLVGLFFAGVAGGAVGAPEAAHDPFQPTHMPTHPVIELAGGNGWWGPFQLLFVAAIVAPIVEETIFRGVLYRHLREATAGAGFAISALLSTVISSFLFAVVHPQGPIAVPALMTLAAGFSVAREWRGSIVAPIVAHSVNNAAIMVMLILCTG